MEESEESSDSSPAVEENSTDAAVEVEVNFEQQDCSTSTIVNGAYCNACGNNGCMECKEDFGYWLDGIGCCAWNYYLNHSGTFCSICNNSCATCRGPLATDCTGCISGMNFEDGAGPGKCVRDYA